MKKVILISAVLASLGLIACGGKRTNKDNSKTIVADSAGNAGSGQGEPTQGAISSGDPADSVSDTSTTKPQSADESQ